MSSGIFSYYIRVFFYIYGIQPQFNAFKSQTTDRECRICLVRIWFSPKSHRNEYMTDKKQSARLHQYKTINRKRDWINPIYEINDVFSDNSFRRKQYLTPTPSVISITVIRKP